MFGVENRRTFNVMLDGGDWVMLPSPEIIIRAQFDGVGKNQISREIIHLKHHPQEKMFNLVFTYV